MAGSDRAFRALANNEPQVVALLEAMASAGLEPVIIEDPVKFGEDQGRAHQGECPCGAF